ncbi:12892_t:CDS:2 [Dentiscutata heterogama]|uniref:12892_t:CDS:1 n=1 Tax=Dentiscutata heterogama TaxID=1316150 RepID=A0ACA9L1G0_9GLOM|nr:12892_t:CDS:2 [Dentiscutata heterogama]
MPNDKKKKLISKSHEEIAAEFQCDRSTVSKILKQKQWSDISEVSKNANAFKTTSPKFPQIEQALGMWIGTAEQRQLILIGEAIRLVKAAWDAISTETLKNCWHHTGILPSQHLAQEVIDLTEDPHLRRLTQDYLDDDEPIETEEALDDERIIELVKNPIVNDNRSDDQVDEEPKITFAEAKSSLNQLLTFIHQQSFQTDSFIKENDEFFFYDFLTRTHQASTKFMKQSTLEHLIIREHTDHP